MERLEKEDDEGVGRVIVCVCVQMSADAWSELSERTRKRVKKTCSESVFFFLFFFRRCFLRRSGSTLNFIFILFL